MRIYAVYLVSTSPPYGTEGSILTWWADFPKKFILHKKTIEETCRFLSKTLTVYCRPGSRTSVEHEEMVINVYHRSDNLAGVVFTDIDYPKRISYALCCQAIEHFFAKFENRWRNNPKDKFIEFKELKKIVQEFEKPNNSDSIARAIENTQATTEILTQTLNNIMIRGETLQILVEKSEELSLRAKMFYKESQKKRCCIIY
jgi:synaptobrevin homolog YKT6